MSGERKSCPSCRMTMKLTHRADVLRAGLTLLLSDSGTLLLLSCQCWRIITRHSIQYAGPLTDLNDVAEHLLDGVALLLLHSPAVQLLHQPALLPALRLRHAGVRHLRHLPHHPAGLVGRGEVRRGGDIRSGISRGGNIRSAVSRGGDIREGVSRDRVRGQEAGQEEHLRLRHCL